MEKQDKSGTRVYKPGIRGRYMSVQQDTFAPILEPVPLERTADGVILVRNTRVPLDTVIFTFLEGASPEEIVWQYPTLDLADVYSVITYYLQHRADVQKYLQEQENLRRLTRQENEQRFSMTGIRQRLLERRSQSTDQC